MKKIIIRSASIFAIPLGLVLSNTTFSPAVYAQSQELPNTNTQKNSSNNSVCDSVPPARPTGGATSIRLQVLQQCYKNTP